MKLSVLSGGAAHGLVEALAPQFKAATGCDIDAMRALASSTTSRPIGCTQVTEILATPGVDLAGPLPKEFELATLYTAGVCTRAASPNRRAGSRLS